MKPLAQTSSGELHLEHHRDGAASSAAPGLDCAE